MPDAHPVETNTRRQWLLAAFVASFYPLPGLKRAFSIIGILLALWELMLIGLKGPGLKGASDILEYTRRMPRRSHVHLDEIPLHIVQRPQPRAMLLWRRGLRYLPALSR